MQPPPPDVTMAPAYGGMFRPPPRRTGRIVALIVLAVVIGIGGLIGGVRVWRKHQLRSAALDENGKPCVYGCNYGLCIHEGGDRYCGMNCEQYGDCPSGFTCKPSRSGRHHACMK